MYSKTVLGGAMLIMMLFFGNSLFAQKTISGIVVDEQSESPVAFASVIFLNTNTGTLTNTEGHFKFELNNLPADSIIITCVGYQRFAFYIDKKTDSVDFSIKLVRAAFNDEVVVKSKTRVSRGLYLWRKIVQNKPENDRYKFENFGFEVYNKLELDIKNVNFDKITRIKPLNALGNILAQNIDTAEGTIYLPTYLTESISDYYFQKKPQKIREIIKATNTLGVENESVQKLLGNTDQVVNFYSNYILIANKQFVSPINDNGDYYYKYSVPDTQMIHNVAYYHLVFTPRRDGSNTFEGDCWVHSKNFGILKASLRLGKEANINFVNNLSLIQDYTLINDTTWSVSKDKFVIDIAPLGKKAPSFIGRKTTTYKNFIYNSPLVATELEKNKKLDEVVLIVAESANQTKAYWNLSRHEGLTKTEAGIIKMIDTLLHDKKIVKLRDNLLFIGTGYKDVGKFQIGPWFNWMTYNNQEGYRVRFDIGTQKEFNRHIWWHTYLAYGFGDKSLKGKVELFYLPSKHPRRYVYGSYLNDLDFGQNYYGEVSADNIFALAIRKPNALRKFMRVEEKKLEFFNEHLSGFSELVSITNKSFKPLANLPSRDSFPMPQQYVPLSNFEVSIKLRYAYTEKFLENTFFRQSLGSPYPITEFTLSRGIKGILGSSYNYVKLFANISDYVPIAPLGNLNYQVFAGKTFGTLPYVFLDIAPGNDMYYYNKYAFNMMNRFEFIHDRFVGLNVEHNVGNGIFMIFPKLKLRQFWTAKALWGSLSNANMEYNFKAGSNFKSLNGETYLELGTGVDNIFKVFRIDCIWRVLPQSMPDAVLKKFGVFGSFRLTF